MGFIKEFKSFAFKGNVVDLAVGVIIGAAFGKIISSLVEDVITPLLLNPALKTVGAENIAQLSWNGVKYGSFLSASISFLCISMVLFWLIKFANRINKPEEKEASGPTKDQILLTEIRDLLKNRA
ncbi:MAG: large conductance mechanosensitive channel protein MscL [Kaistella sp.]|nr:large conductance mechanosensitive channel protein MscL [Kaistella sp.]